MNIDIEQSSGYDLSPLQTKVTKADIEEYLKATPENKSQLHGRMALRIMPTIFLVICTTFAIGFAGTHGSTSLMVGGLGVIAALLCLGLLSYSNYELSRQIQMHRLAKANNLVLDRIKDSSGYGGMIFSVGRERKTANVISSQPGANLEFEMGQHIYVTGSGKSRQVFRWWYIRVDLKRNLPHMVLDSKNNNMSLFGASISNLPASLKKSQQIQLEGDFNDKFILYGPNGYDVDVRYVFTPDLMALMIDDVANFDAEIIDDKIYFYQRDSGMAMHPQKGLKFFEQCFKIVTVVGSKVDRQTDYYADHRVGSREVDLVAPQGRRLKRGVGVAALVFFIIYTVFTLLRIISDF